jgi:Na+(H+)/acetate symporter ActP
LSYLVVVVVVVVVVAAIIIIIIIIITAPQNIKNQLKSSTENEKTELKSTPMHGHFYRDPQRPSVDN